MLTCPVQASEPNDDVTKILIYYYETQCIVGRRSLFLCSNLVDSNIVGGQQHAMVREVEYRRQGKGVAYYEPVHIQWLLCRSGQVRWGTHPDHLRLPTRRIKKARVPGERVKSCGEAV